MAIKFLNNSNVEGSVTVSKKLLLESADYDDHLSIRRGAYGYDTIVTGTRIDYSPTSSTDTFKFLAKVHTTGQLIVNNGIEMTSGNFNAGDNERIRLGNSSDLQIYHDGSNSFIEDRGVGSLYINGSSVYLRANDNENAVVCNANSSVDLYHNGSATPKLQTTSAGIYVEGEGVFTGNVGIGTTSPLSRLHVVSREINNGANKGIRIENYNGTKDYSIRTGVSGYNNTSLAFYDETAGANRMVIASNGNVGIGTTSPSDKLHVIGNATISGEVIFKPKHYGASDDLNNDNRSIFSTHQTNNTTPNRPVNYSSIYTFGGSVYNALQISTNEDYSESGMWIRQYNQNSASPQGTGWQNWTEVWTTNHAPLSKIANWDAAYTYSQVGHLPLAGGTMTGNLTLSYAYPRINLYDTNNDSDYSIINNDGSFSIYDVTNNSHRLSIASGGNATFAGDIILRQNATYLKSTDSNGAEPRMFGINSSNNTYIGPIDGYAGGAIFYGVSANVSAQTFFTGASARMHINSTGNVGIGTTSPSDKLDVSGRVVADAFRTDVNTGHYSVISRSSAGNPPLYVQSGDSGTDQPIAKFFYGNANPGQGSLVLNVGKDKSYFTNTNVGIGTTDPNTKVEIESFTPQANRTFPLDILTITGEGSNLPYTGFGGGIVFKNRTYTYGVRNSARIRSYIDADSASNRGAGLIFEVTDSNQTYNPSVFLKYNGNVGIGTTDPGAKLHVVGTSNFQGNIQVSGGTFVDSTRRNIYLNSFDGGDGNGIFFRDGFTYNASITVEDHNGSSADGICISGYDGVSFSTGANSKNERMRIATNGNVGIGTTSPTRKLSVVDGDIDIKGGANSRLFLNIDTNYLYGDTNGVVMLLANDNVRFRTQNIERMRIDSNGNVGIGVVPADRNVLDIRSDDTNGVFVTHRNDTGFFLNRTYADYNNDGTTVEYQERIGVDGNRSSIGNFSNHTLGIRTNNQDRITVLAGGNVGIGTTNPQAMLDVQPTASNRKVTRIANDVMSTYFYNTQADAVLAWTCGSYYQAEVVITANQTNGGTYNNLYIRGIWSNNHTSHHWDELERVGSLSNSTFTMSVGQNGATTNSGRLELDFDYNGGSFAQLNVRVTDFYGTHSYTIT